MKLFQHHASDPKTDAQRNLQGRTHYVDDETLRWHKSRVISTHGVASSQGLLYAIITSDALDIHNTKRGFRYVIFDVFGTVLKRPDLEHSYRAFAQAYKAMWVELQKIDPFEHTRLASRRSLDEYTKEMHGLIDEVTRLERKAVGKVPEGWASVDTSTS